MYLRQKAYLRAELTDLAIGTILIRREILKSKSEIKRLEALKAQFSKPNDIEYLEYHILQHKEAIKEKTKTIKASTEQMASLRFQARPASFLILSPPSK